jgi:hypothetical protein
MKNIPNFYSFTQFFNSYTNAQDKNRVLQKNHHHLMILEELHMIILGAIYAINKKPIFI